MAGLFIKLDTNFWSHPKIIAAGEPAAVLYQQMAMYCMDHATDGFVPEGQLPRFGLARCRQRILALAAVDLIEPTDGGWMLPGYVERYKTRAEVDELRAKRAEAGRKGGRPRKQVAKATGNQVAFTAQNPEEEEEEEVEPSSSSHGPAARPPDPTDDDDGGDGSLTLELLELAGLARPRPTRGEYVTVDRLLGRGWASDQLRGMALRASQADVDPRAYLAQMLREALNTDPPAAATGQLSSAPPLLGERQPCPNPDCVDGMVGGFGPDGRPEPPWPCPTCHVLGATA